MSEEPNRNTARARELRNTATPAEKRLWNHLKQRQLTGAKFSRQMPVGPYFADFLCRISNLVIELDGHSHDFTVSEDTRRNRYMEAQGYTVLRFTNHDVRDNLDGVLEGIKRALRPTPVRCADLPSRTREGRDDDLSPLPRAGGAGGKAAGMGLP